MEFQKRVLGQYLELSNNPTLKVIAMDTGIQITRVFRILNGSEMRLKEFLAFNRAVEKRMGAGISLGNLALECMHTLSAEALCEIQADMERRLKLWRFGNTNQVRRPLYN